MKKIFTISSFLILSVVFLAGCTKRSGGYGSDEDYWLSQERGIVVYSDSYCPYYVVETNYGYTIIEAVNGYSPYEGDAIYGNLSRIGYTDLYNRSARTIIRGDIVDYWLTYAEAQYMIDDLCYYGAKSSDKKKIKPAGIITEQKHRAD
jgi:hypothetical protein